MMSPFWPCFPTDGIRFATFIVPVKGRSDCFVIGDSIRLLVIRWDGKASKATIVRELACLGPDHVDNRFNDGKVDPWGRLYVGSMLNESAGNPFEKATGALWRYCDRTGQMVEQDRNMYISNGLAWNRATNKFYFVDSGANHIKEYDIDLDGNLSKCGNGVGSEKLCIIDAVSCVCCLQSIREFGTISSRMGPIRAISATV